MSRRILQEFEDPPQEEQDDEQDLLVCAPLHTDIIDLQDPVSSVHASYLGRRVGAGSKRRNSKGRK